MPTGTFIPISTTFKSIQDACKTPTEVSRNLLSTFNEASIKSPQPSQIVIKPTPVEIRISDIDEDIGLMINEEIQTDTTCVEDMQVQTAPQKGESKEVQTNWVATDVCNQIIQTEVAATEQETQTENPSTEQETQTEVTATEQETQTENPSTQQETQTENPSTQQEMQTENPSTEQETQTEIANCDILTVNKIEVVDQMESWGTQTDIVELAAMSPILPLQNMEMDHSETESIVSLVSSISTARTDDVPKCKTDDALKSPCAGIDMRVGEYRELQFPPVLSTVVSQKPLEVNKGRSPSPVDLSTTKQPEDKNEKKSPEKKPADKLKKPCTFSEDPREVLRYIPKATAAQLKLAPAHHAVEMSMHSPKLGDAIPIFTPTPPADLTKKSDDATKKSDDATNKSDNITKKSDDATKKSDDATNKSDDATKKSDDATKKSDEATKKSDKPVIDTSILGITSKRPLSTSSYMYSPDSKRMSTFSTSPAIKALQSHSFAEGYVPSEGRSAFSSLCQTLVSTPDHTTTGFSLSQSLQSIQNDSDNLSKFCSIFSRSSNISKGKRHATGKLISWNPKMQKTVGERDSMYFKAQMSSEDDSGIVVDGRTNSPGRGEEFSQADENFLRSSQELSTNFQPQDSLLLDNASDSDDYQISPEEEDKLLTDISDGTHHNFTISVQVHNSAHQVSSNSLSKEKKTVKETSTEEQVPKTDSETPSQKELENKDNVTPTRKESDKKDSSTPTEKESNKTDSGNPTEKDVTNKTSELEDKGSAQVEKTTPSQDRSVKEEKQDKEKKRHQSSSSTCSSSCSSSNGSSSNGSSSGSSPTLSYKQLRQEESDDSQNLDGDDGYNQNEGGSGNEEEPLEKEKENTGAQENVKSPPKQLILPKSREKRIKDYMSSIGSGSIQVKITGHTEQKEDKAAVWNRKIEEQQNAENATVKPTKNKTS